MLFTTALLKNQGKILGNQRKVREKSGNVTGLKSGNPEDSYLSL